MAFETSDDPYLQGYWDADNLLHITTGSDYCLSRPLIDALLKHADDMATRAPYGRRYQDGARERLAEHDAMLAERNMDRGTTPADGGG